MIELRDGNGGNGGGDGAPIGNPQPWIAADGGVQRRKGEGRGEMKGVRTVPVRSVEEGAFVMEVWVDEAKGNGKGEGEGDGVQGGDVESGGENP